MKHESFTVKQFLDHSSLFKIFMLSIRWQKVCLQYRRPRFNPWVRTIPWKREWQLPPVFSPGNHGRSLVGYSPWSHKDLDTTEWLILLTLTLIMNLNTPEIYRLFLKKKKKVLSFQISFPQGNILLTVRYVLLDPFLVLHIFYTFFSPTKHAIVLSKLLPYKRWHARRSHKKPSLQDSSGPHSLKIMEI